MYDFLIPLLTGFACNWASAFTHFFSSRWGEGGGRLATFILRNILGIPLWVFGLILAYRKPAPLLFTPRPATTIMAWLLLLLGSVLMIWALALLGIRSFRPTGQDTLVCTGIYNFVRHPIYSGLLIDFIALALQRPAAPVLLACALGWAYANIQARCEELDLVRRIPPYRQYMAQVPRFFPRLRRR
jgi:protein-S-isoprenylcysteine O-methyltransferase Ste14